MHVNSNITLNSYEGMNQVPTPLPITMPPATVPAGQSLASTAAATMDKPLVQPEQYQAQLENKKALDMFGQSTVINIGMGGRCPKSPVVDPAKVNTPTATTPATSTPPAPANPLTNPATTSMASEKFLESFSKMLDGFLSSVSKMLDTFMTKMTDMIKKGNTPAPVPATPTTPAAPVTTSPAPSTTPSVVSTPSTNTATVAPAAPRDLKPWEVKANEYLKTDEKGMVAESDMQEAVMKFQLYQKSDVAEKVIIQELEKAKASTQNRQSAIKTALKNTVASGAITPAEADYVYSISFRASQFDAETDKISTAKSTGGLSSNNAIQLGAVNLTMIREGNLKLDSLSVAN